VKEEEEEEESTPVHIKRKKPFEIGSNNVDIE
jgi:hypothetical protein